MTARGAAASRRQEGSVRVGIYCRISNDPTGLMAGVERQEKECRDLVARRPGWHTAELYVDNDVSASRYAKRKRPMFEQLLIDLEAGLLDAIVVWHPDRLYRRLVDLSRIIDIIEKRRALVATCMAGDVDLTTATGRTHAKLAAVIGEGEVERLSERARAANRHRAVTGGRFPAGVRCFGYSTNNVDVVAEEAVIVKEVARRLLNGESSRSVCKDLTERGVTTTQGRPWTPGSLRVLMMNPRLIGKRTYRGEVVGDGPQAPILDRDTHERLMAMFTAPERLNLRLPQTRTYLLTGGLAICQLCGVHLQAQPSNSGKRGYVCKKISIGGKQGCGRIRIAADGLEEEVAAQLLVRLSSPAWRSKLSAASLPDASAEDSQVLAVQAQQIEERLSAAQDDYLDGVIGRDQWVDLQARAKTRLERLREQIRQAARLGNIPDPDPKALQEWWQHASVDSQRELVQTCINYIEIGPATRIGFTGLDPDRIRIDWKV